MSRKYLLASGFVCLLALAMGCGQETPTPISPSGVPAGETDAGADGSTLKATAPSIVSPTGGGQLEQGDVVLTLNNAQPKYGTVALSYRFEVFNESGAKVYTSPLVNGGNGRTSHTVTESLDSAKNHTWRARAEYLGAVGPWSGTAAFKTADQSNGYIRGNELYDPLMNGKTVGTINGPVQFIENQGVRLDDFFSHISYQLEQTLTEGSYSLLISNIPANTEGGKTKLFAMGQGYDDIVTNDRRMTVEKRGEPAGIVAWRLLTHDDQVDTEGPEREYVNFLGDRTYFWEASWIGNYFNVLSREGGPNGPTVYEKGKGFHGRPYDPTPHVIYVGSPVGRSGPEGATVPGMIARQVWVSSRPRPAFANR